MKITNYIMYSKAVRVFFSNGNFTDIYFNEFSGKVYYRRKIDTIMNVKHAGIYVGQDTAGNGFFIHNHYQIGKPALVYANDFTLGKQIHLYNERCVNPWNITISKAFDHVIRQEPYKLLSYNCQTMTNSACNNVRKSEDVGKVLGNVAAGVGLFLLFGALLSGKD